MIAQNINLREYNLAVVIPCYRVEREIISVLSSLPHFIQHIIVVDDASPDASADLVMKFARQDACVILLRYEKNRGGSGAMIIGFREALEVEAQSACANRDSNAANTLRLAGDSIPDCGYRDRSPFDTQRLLSSQL
jgi:glycosyltransferase involved in cell wall biosynthesis